MPLTPRRLLVGTLALILLGLTPLVTEPSPAQARARHTVQTLHFAVTVGPPGEERVCDIVGDLYVPARASRRHRAPAVLTTHGFGGSKADMAGFGRLLADRGYVVLSYSGLGFGGSGCKVTLDDPDVDGRAGQQLVSYLGGAPGIAFLDAEHTEPAPRLRVVRLDREHGRHDPRVGMIGGSYGGGVQFAVASRDRRVDTIVPLITWNDLSYALSPNHTDQVTGVTTATPGAIKVVYGSVITAFGVRAGATGAQDDPSRLVGCPNLAEIICAGILFGLPTGYFPPATIEGLQHASVAHYVRRIKVPVLLVQAQRDTLFNLNEAVATYRALQRQGTEVKMMWQQWGHSDQTVPGEISLADPDPRTQHTTARTLDWLDHYLMDRPVSTGPEFEYARPWVDYEGSAEPAYRSSRRFPVGRTHRYTLSGTGDLVREAAAAEPATSRFLTPGAGAPTGMEDPDAVKNVLGLPDLEPQDLPGTYAAFRTAPLAADLDVVGSPVARLGVEAPTAMTTQEVGPAGQLVLFVKVVDVAPDGTRRLINGLEAPVRVPDVDRRFTVTLPGIVHRFERGHQLELVVAGGTLNYRGGALSTPVSITSGPGQTLRLPVVGS
ncbi:CocE/NonD family hydrolase [Nocardioides marinus]|uniref:ABC-2 type transport system ATP-binding protein n=1 Tax=Nocardioides marinus TaxID=374514 RepID=A0A7Y9YDS7_9ACTN|nr:CocE/NonD family hydrolase [Nocardioides marinus]NYI09229.1 ABC-2 type transport system ATP-binding protein [Nocardioides marinus]